MPYELVHFDDDVPAGGAPWGVLKDDRLTWSHLLMEQRGSSVVPLVCDIADTKFVEYRWDCGATSGDNRGIYNRLYFTGANPTGGGESLRSYTEIVGVAVGTAHGAHLSLGMGEGATGGAITGLGAAVRATLGLPNVALAAGGTYCAVMAEIYSFGSAADPSAVTELSYFRVVHGGDSTGLAKVEDKAYLFSFVGGTLASGNMIGALGNEPTWATSKTFKIRCLLPSGVVGYLVGVID